MKNTPLKLNQKTLEFQYSELNKVNATYKPLIEEAKKKKDTATTIDMLKHNIPMQIAIAALTVMNLSFEQEYELFTEKNNTPSKLDKITDQNSAKLLGGNF